MKAAELVEMDNESLAGKLKESRRELYELRFKLAVGQLDDHRQIRKVRLDIARIMTSLRQRELGLSVDPGATDLITTSAPAPKAQPKAEVTDAEEPAGPEAAATVGTTEAKSSKATKVAKPAIKKTAARGKAIPKAVTRRVGKTVSKSAKAAPKTGGRPTRASAKKTADKKTASKKTAEETE